MNIPAESEMQYYVTYSCLHGDKWTKNTELVHDKIEPQHEISNNVVCVTSKTTDQAAYTGSLIRAFASPLNSLWLLSYWPNSTWSF